MRPSRRLLLAGSASLFALSAFAAEPAQPHISRIAFGSSLIQDSPNQGIWDAILRYKPHLLLFAGDTVYGDMRDGKPVAEADVIANLRDAYEKIAAIPNLERLRSRTKTMAIWDDHDYGRNDGGADFPLKAESKALFLSFWKAADDDLRHSRDGLYTSEMLGPEDMRVQVIMLDTRFFRSPLKKGAAAANGRGPYLPDDSATATMLGAEQWQWLAEELKRPAALRIIVSSVQVLSEGHGWETWANMPKERDRLLKLIADSKANGVVLVSGDRRFGALYKNTAALPYPLHEVTASGLTHSFLRVKEQLPNQIGPPYGDLNFGTIDIDWWARTVSLQIRAANGETMRRIDLAFADIRAAQ